MKQLSAIYKNKGDPFPGYPLTIPKISRGSKRVLNYKKH